MKYIATLIYIYGIYKLFVWDRDPESHPTGALWIPTVWLLIIGSRPVSLWMAAFGLSGGGGDVSADYYLEGSPLDRYVFLLLLGWGLLVLFQRSPKVEKLLGENAGIVLFFLYCAVSSLWSEHPDVAIKRWIKAVGDVVMVAIVLTEPNRADAVKRILSRLAFPLLTFSVLLIKYYPEIGRGQSKSWENLFSGVTTQKNNLGLICLFLGVASLWRFAMAYENRMDPSRKKLLMAHGAMLAVTLWLFKMSNAMTSLSGFLMAGALILVIRGMPAVRKSAAIHLLIISMAILPVFAVFFDSGGGLVGSLGRNSNLTGRTDIWNLVLSMAGNPLFGTGFESFWLGDRIKTAWGTIFEGLNEAHNGYLEVYLNLGWIGVALLVVLIVAGYRRIVAAIRRNPDATLWLGFYFGAQVYSMSEAGFRALSSSWIFFLMAIMACPAVSEPVSHHFRSRFGEVDDVDKVKELSSAREREAWV